MKRLALFAGLACVCAAAHADPCGGDQLETRAVSAGAAQIGVLEVYYDRDNKEYCAELKHVGSTVGKPVYTRVSMAECKDYSCREVVAPVDSDGASDYLQKAGPVRIKARPVSRAGAQCVVANGLMMFEQETQVAHGAPHCR